MDELPQVPLSQADTIGAVPQASVLVAGRVLGPYRLHRILGRGGFAEVWEVERRDNGLRVALKVLHGASDANPGEIERFVREGRLAASLSHPRSVYIFSAERLEGLPAITMELVPGGTLQDRLARDGALPPQEAVDCILDVLEGLEAAARLGIVHRDIKPSNCFVDGQGRVKIGDYGISTSLRPSHGLTTTGQFLGTPAYASPEQVRGEKLDERSDMYSAGATLYALIAGQPPFPAPNSAALMARILTDAPPPLATVGRKVHPSLESVVMRMLHKDPASRFPTISAAREALAPFSSQASLPAPPLPRVGAALLDLALGLLLMMLPFMMLAVFESQLLAYFRPGAKAISDSAWNHAVDCAMFVLIGLVVACEGFWQGTPGKRLLRMRIRDVSGGRATWLQVLTRNALFLVPFVVPDIIVPKEPWTTVLGLAFLFALFSSMRARNGYAGLHEILSRTRVIRSAPERRSVPVLKSVEPLAVPSGSASGHSEVELPYRLVRRLWQSPEEALALAVDESLGREVWIHEPSRPAIERSARRQPLPGRPTEVRRLREGLGEGRAWVAYEAPSGTSFRDHVEQRGRLRWSELRGLLLSLCDEIAVRQAAGSDTQELTLAHLWVDLHGQLRVLDFPWNEPTPHLPGALPAQPGWRALARQVILVGLDGVDPGLSSDLAGTVARPRARLPERTRAVVDDLWRETGVWGTPAEFSRALGETGVQDLTLGRGRRAVQIGLASALAGLAWLLPVHVPHLHEWFEDKLNLTASACAVGAVPAMLLAWLFRGGPLLRLFAMRVHTSENRPASRARCLARAAWAALPGLAFLLPYLVGGMLNATPGHFSIHTSRQLIWDELARQTGPERARKWSRVLDVVGPVKDAQLAFCKWTHVPPYALHWFGDGIGLIMILAGGIAILRPGRGLHDRLAGTCLVPRG